VSNGTGEKGVREGGIFGGGVMMEMTSIF